MVTHAMGCQRTIAAQIIDQKAGLGLKGNLHEDVACCSTNGRMVLRGPVTLHESFEKGHGRLETRRVVATDDLAWLQKDHQWPGMRSVAKVEVGVNCWSQGRRGDPLLHQLAAGRRQG